MTTETATLETATLELTDVQWQIVHKIAQGLADQQFQIDPKKDGIETELKKILSYFVGQLRATNSASDNLGKQFFIYVEVLKRNSENIGHGKHNTSRYYTAIERVCKKPLSEYLTDPEKLFFILGWAIRLIRFYKNGESLDFRKVSNQKSTQPKATTTMAAAFEKLGF